MDFWSLGFWLSMITICGGGPPIFAPYVNWTNTLTSSESDLQQYLNDTKSIMARDSVHYDGGGEVMVGRGNLTYPLSTCLEAIRNSSIDASQRGFEMIFGDAKTVQKASKYLRGHDNWWLWAHFCVVRGPNGDDPKVQYEMMTDQLLFYPPNITVSMGFTGQPSPGNEKAGYTAVQLNQLLVAMVLNMAVLTQRIVMTFEVYHVMRTKSFELYLPCLRSAHVGVRFQLVDNNTAMTEAEVRRLEKMINYIGPANVYINIPAQYRDLMYFHPDKPSPPPNRSSDSTPGIGPFLAVLLWYMPIL